MFEWPALGSDFQNKRHCFTPSPEQGTKVLFTFHIPASFLESCSCGLRFGTHAALDRKFSKVRRSTLWVKWLCGPVSAYELRVQHHLDVANEGLGEGNGNHSSVLA